MNAYSWIKDFYILYSKNKIDQMIVINYPSLMLFRLAYSVNNQVDAQFFINLMSKNKMNYKMIYKELCDTGMIL